MGFFSGLRRGASTAEHAGEDLSTLSRLKNVFRGAERAEETAEEAGKVGKKIESATGALKKAGKGITAAGTAAFSAFQLLTFYGITDNISDIVNAPSENLMMIIGIIGLFVVLGIIAKLVSATGTVKDVAVSAKNKTKSGGGVKKLSDTVCFFILISFIFIINFLYEKYLELEKEKEKIIQPNYQSIQNY